MSLLRLTLAQISTSPDNFLPWNPVLASFQGLADGLTAAAYLSIAATLIYIARRQVRFGRLTTVVLGLFAAFLFTAGLGHAAAFTGLWTAPDAWTGAVKIATAVFSVAAAAALVRSLPTVLQLPTRAEFDREKGKLEFASQARHAELSAANDLLRAEADQRKDAEAEVLRLNTELQAHVTELQSLFKVLPVGVAIATDSTCENIRSNEAFAEMMGLPANRNASLSAPPFQTPSQVRVVHDGKELAASDQPMQRAVAQNTPVRDFEATLTRPDGVTLEVLVNAVPIRDGQGQPRGCVATFQDISGQKQAERKRLDFERRLLQSQKLESIGVLAGGIAHDFNNLLTGVLGHANFARSELSRGSTNVDHLLAQVETSAQRAADLCRQLLAYAGKGRIVVRLIDLNVAIQQTVPLLNLSVSKKVTLDLQLGASLPPLRGDPSQINQVLLNLVTNASEAIGTEAGTVTIRTERVNVTPMDMLTLTASPEMEPGTFICLEVRDTGCGIAPETISHIFEPFFTTKFVGRGLGLAAVIGIVHGHRGGIRVSSQVGVGTTFELFFPVVAAPARGSSPTFASPGASARGTVLVVDDDATVREFAGTVLSSVGFQVVSAVDGEDALAKLRRDPMQFDAVLLDLTMPKLDGEDTLMALRMIAPHLPVVLTSGYGEQAVVQRFVGRGLADFLPKPFMTEALVHAIHTAIERTRASSQGGAAGAGR
jgi:two-component system cell cycle sensor histidine kinase/response regulator CckA